MTDGRLVLPPHVVRERQENIIDLEQIKRAAKAATDGPHRRSVPRTAEESEQALKNYAEALAAMLDRFGTCVKKKRNPTAADIYMFAESLSSFVSLHIAMLQVQAQNVDRARVNLALHLRGYGRALMKKGLVTDEELDSAMKELADRGKVQPADSGEAQAPS